MIKLCTKCATHPLALIFQNSLAAGTFGNQWKRAIILPIDDKNDKQVISNYRVISLLPICSKTFGKLTLNKLFKFFEVKNLLYNHQSGFDPDD